ncbi:MAG: oxidoreductase, partial [Eubacterium sp.]|nr:oxidoreductase [Eubacterium sp.]
FSVAEIFANPGESDYVYLKKIASLSPDTRIYSNLEPTMIYYDSFDGGVDIAVGKDAGYYYPQAAGVEWSQDIQPFGYAGLRHFFRECDLALSWKRAVSRKEGAL